MYYMDCDQALYGHGLQPASHIKMAYHGLCYMNTLCGVMCVCVSVCVNTTVIYIYLLAPLFFTRLENTLMPRSVIS